jgi:hypothetical protein
MKKLLLLLLLWFVPLSHAQAPASSLMGCSSTGTCAPGPVTLGTGLSMSSGGVLSATGNLPSEATGNVICNTSGATAAVAGCATQVVYASQFGISSSNTASQNNTGLALLQTYLQSSSTVIWEVVFAPSSSPYLYTNNRWLFGVRNVIIDGYGVSFENTNTSAAYSQSVPLYINDPFDDTGSAFCCTTYVNGYTVNTISQGVASLITSTAANSSNFAVGNEVLLYGFSQQEPSYPPADRYFEYAYVSAVNAATISGVAITGTAGQFSCTCTGLTVGAQVAISGTFGGTGSITGYSNPTNYYVSATNGTSTFTLQTSAQAAIVTTAGTPTGLTYTETGTVTLTEPIKNFYDSRWWDVANSSTGLNDGAPRVLNLNRTNYNQANLIYIRGATFIADPNYAANNDLPIQLPANLLILEDVTASNFNLVASERAIVRRGAYVGCQSDTDKEIDFAEIHDSILSYGTCGGVRAFGDGATNNNLYMDHNLFYGQVSAGSRHWVMDDNDIIPSSSSYSALVTGGSTSPITTASFKDTRVANTGGIGYAFVNQISPGYSLTAGTGSGANTIEITLNIASNGPYVDYGLTVTDATTSCTSTGITAIYASGSTEVITAPGCTYTSGDTINFYDVNTIYDQGGNTVIGPTQVPFFRGPPGPTASVLNNATLTGASATVSGYLTVSGSATQSSFAGGLNVGSGKELSFNLNAYLKTSGTDLEFYQNGIEAMYMISGDTLFPTPVYLSGTGTQTLAPASNTSIDGWVLQDTTAAPSSGNQQFSPRIHLIGQGWKTTATAGSETVDEIIEEQPVQGTTTPTGSLVFSHQINAGGYVVDATLTSAGVWTTTGPMSATYYVVSGSTLPSTAGIYYPSTNTLGFGVGGASVGKVTSTGINSAAIGASTASTGAFTTLAASGATTLPGIASSSAATTGTICWTTGTGNLTVDTTLACLSSLGAWKKDIEPLNVGLDELLKLHPVSYELKPEYDPEHLGRQVGLLAEDVEKVDKRLVGYGGDGQLRGVRYMQMVALVTAGVQDMEAQIQRQQLEIYALALWSLLLTGWLAFKKAR